MLGYPVVCRRLPPSTVLLAFLLLLFSCTQQYHPVSAQQAPSWYFTNPLHDDISISCRQNLCQRSTAFANGTLALEDALQGLQLRPMISVRSQEYFRLVGCTTIGGNNGASTGGMILDETNPGVIAILLDELSRRAGFTWRDSYGHVGHKCIRHEWRLGQSFGRIFETGSRLSHWLLRCEHCLGGHAGRIGQ